MAMTFDFERSGKIGQYSHSLIHDHSALMNLFPNPIFSLISLFLKF